MKLKGNRKIKPKLQGMFKQVINFQEVFPPILDYLKQKSSKTFPCKF